MIDDGEGDLALTRSTRKQNQEMRFALEAMKHHRNALGHLFISWQFGRLNIT